jgi:RNA polymerase sigma factor (TIGR02999 family)
LETLRGTRASLTAIILAVWRAPRNRLVDPVHAESSKPRDTWSLTVSDVTRLLLAIEQGDTKAADLLLPVVYDELRALAAQKLKHEPPGQTIQATALVHEAYLRLIGPNRDGVWDGKGHFFAAAARAMRRILVENARRKRRLKQGGDQHRVELDDNLIAIEPPCEDLIALDEALEQLVQVDAEAAEVVNLHFFSGLTMEQAAEVVGISARSAYRRWDFARAWLFRYIRAEPTRPDS